MLLLPRDEFRKGGILLRSAIVSASLLTNFESFLGFLSAYPTVPCIKICSNSTTFRPVQGDMDINAGAVISEGLSPKDLGEQCVSYLLEVCNGLQTAPERRGYGGAMCVFSASHHCNQI